MKIAIFLMALLTLSATTVATISITSNVSLPILNNQMQTLLFDADFGDVEPNGDEVIGGGGAPG